MKRTYLACALAVLPACDRVFQLDTVVLGAGDDGGMQDSDTNGTHCFGTQLVQLCVPGPLAAELVLGGALDTGSDERCHVVAQPVTQGPELCVLAASTIRVANVVTVIGPRALVLVAETSITVDALLDVSSTKTRTGPAAPPSCGGIGDGDNGSDGAAGGSGGTFGHRGGGAQSGDDGNARANAPSEVTELADVRGGCPGYSGGISASGGPSAVGGAGGGAVYAIANGAIVVSGAGRINASGAGGRGGVVKSGGGGGGAGGLIALDAPVVTVRGELFAMGAGAGGGGSTTSAAMSDGGEAQGATDPAPGGAAGAGTGGGFGAPGCGGPNGGVGGVAPGQPALAGGGGGGGGCGYIRVWGSRDITAATSPAVTP